MTLKPDVELRVQIWAGKIGIDQHSNIDFYSCFSKCLREIRHSSRE